MFLTPTPFSPIKTTKPTQALAWLVSIYHSLIRVGSCLKK
ncbi:hypothetical protein HPHPH41_0289 [Helicobacter pylori Hp H-41]|nr:hypothetical protein HPHPH41_0289 [Helicobacter pylori Hp H-41]